MGVTERGWGRLSDGREISLYTLTNQPGLAADIMTYGGILVGLRVPDRQGQLADVTLGFASLELYLAGHPYFGALIGRYGNRIARGAFRLDEVDYQLATNDGPNHLHGGQRGFDKVVWRATASDGPSGPQLQLDYTSPANEEGYPGRLDVTVTYRLTDQNELQIDYLATTDQPTIVNLTQHAYFNLAGRGDVLGHEIELAADAFLPVDATLIPSGELRSVAGTPMDLRRPTVIGQGISPADEQIRLAGGGYDHCWVLRPHERGAAARVVERSSGRTMEVFTSQPGIQLYTGNMLDGTLVGRDGRRYAKHAGLCLETQHFPDSPNRPHFPSVVLRPGERHASRTVYRFGLTGG